MGELGGGGQDLEWLLECPAFGSGERVLAHPPGHYLFENFEGGDALAETVLTGLELAALALEVGNPDQCVRIRQHLLLVQLARKRLEAPAPRNHIDLRLRCEPRPP